MPDNQTEGHIASEATSTATPIKLGESIPTTAPTSSLAVSVTNATGVVTFQLVVTDNLGQQSAPAVAQVTIQAPPVAVLAATPATVAEGGAITLDGSKSTSTGTGSITTYTFTLEPPT